MAQLILKGIFSVIWMFFSLVVITTSIITFGCNKFERLSGTLFCVGTDFHGDAIITMLFVPIFIFSILFGYWVYLGRISPARASKFYFGLFASTLLCFLLRSFGLFSN